MEKILEKTFNIKKLAKSGAILDLIFLIGAVVFLIIMLVIYSFCPVSYIPNPVYNIPDLAFIFAKISYILFVVLICCFSATNVIFAILLIINSYWIFVTQKIKEDEESKLIIKSYKSTILVLSFLALFFSIIFLVIIWILSKTQINFLEKKIEELKIENKIKSTPKIK